ncbi:putative amino-acid metabolite efflux pump [mine drainage metagenome]|uniref:Putative amino-acid metabolite efflux pump n=1 Tax=mine drainage metagenome TaxID=410659 RepID=A0A1J5Q7M9_9ZZZZ
MKPKHFAFLAPAIWGSTYLVTTQILPANKPLLAAAVRALPAGLILIIGRPLPSLHWITKLFVLGALNIGVFFVLLFVAAYRLPGGIVALVGSVQPLIVIALSIKLLTQSVTQRQAISAVVGGLGVALLISLPSTALDPIGLLAAFGATISMACGLVLTKKWGRPSNLNLLTFTGWQLFCGGLVIVPFLLITEPFPSSLTTINLFGFLYLAIPGSLFAYFVWFAGLEVFAPVAMSLLGFISPMVALSLGFFFLNQKLSIAQMIGAALVIGAIFYSLPKWPKFSQGLSSARQEAAKSI